MDVVRAFNNELSGLYEVKPPISKAKMTSITRTAIKAIKFYKHVVQSVEKFILKCKPEYKVPGLYVIDSIVRQSRHQFGPDKDVFAPRFAKNMQLTFSNLFSCPPEEKGKIIRVLNLWQKNQVFTPDVIQPLFDQLADPNNPIHREPSAASNGVSMVERTPPAPSQKPSVGVQGTPSGGKSGEPLPTWVKVAQAQIEAANKAILELSGVAGALGQQKSSNSGSDILQQLQQLQHLILNATPQKQERSDQVLFDKKLLDYDYGDDDDENTSPHQQNAGDSITNILQNPEILRSLTAIQQHMSQAQMRQQQMEEEKMRKLREMKQQEEEFDKHLAQTVPKLPFAAECDFKQLTDLGGLGRGMASMDENGDSEVECIDDDGHEGRNVELISLVDRSPSSPGGGSRRSSRSPSRAHRRRRSHSRSRSRSDRRRRHRSRSRSRQRHRDRDKEREGGTAKEKERRKKGLPPIKKGHISVCSTTLWIGHLSKLVQQEDLSDTFGGYGDIVSIDLIPPRGCAFVCMNRRQDASRALTRLQNHKLHGKTITLAWAPGKGVKGRDLKDYWEIELGVSYIPWSRISARTNFVELEEGGALDEDTMPDNLKPLILEQLRKHKDEKEKAGGGAEETENTQTSFLGGSQDSLVSPIPPPVMTLLPGMNVPPPGLPTSGGIDTSQPPPSLAAAKAVAMSVGLPQIPPGLPVMAKPGIIMPPFPFANLPPPLGLGVPNMMGSLPIGVPPPSLQSLMLSQSLMRPGLMPPVSMAPSQEKLDNSPNKDINRPRPIEGRPPTINTKDDDSMELDDDDDSKKGFRDKRDWGRSRELDERQKDGKERDDRKERDRDKRGERGREKHRDGRDGRDRRDRGRDSGRSRNRSRSRDRDSSKTSRDRRNRSSDREKSKDRRDDKRDDGGEEKKTLSPWIEVPPVAAAPANVPSPDKPSLLQRLRSIAEGGTGDRQFDSPRDERQGPPIVINLNTGPRPLFGPRGSTPDFGPLGPPNFNDNRHIRPPFNGPGPGFDDLGPGPLSQGIRFEDMGPGGPRVPGPMGPGPVFDEMGPDGAMYNNDMMFEGEGPIFDDRGFGRGRFDGPRPLMGQPFNEPPSDLMMMGGPHGPPMFMDDFPHPGGGPRMRFGPRGPMGPMPRGMGPGLGPMFGPRGIRPLIPRQMSPWLENQGPPMNDRPRLPFEDRPPRERRNSGRRRDKDGPRTSRWSKEENNDDVVAEPTEIPQQEQQPSIENPAESHSVCLAEPEGDQPERDSQTPVYDEPTAIENPIVAVEEAPTVPEPCVVEPVVSEPCIEEQPLPDPEPSGGATPCHDEPSDAPADIEA